MWLEGLHLRVYHPTAHLSESRRRSVRSGFSCTVRFARQWIARRMAQDFRFRRAPLINEARRLPCIRGMAESRLTSRMRYLAPALVLFIIACGSDSHGGMPGDHEAGVTSGGSSSDAGTQAGSSAAAGGRGSSQAGATARAGNTSSAGMSGGGKPSTSGSGGRAAGGATGTGTAMGSGGATPSGGMCTGVGTACDAAQPMCCSGLICVASTGPDYAGCREPCTTAADCKSGCCIPFANIPDKGFCGDAQLCQCAALDETCGGARQCCDGFTCTTYDSTNRLACRPKCTKNSDCDTNCCIAIPTTPDSACFMASWCGK